MKNLTNRKIYLFYLIAIVMVCISFVFTNISYDGEYQLAMAYRMIKGDAFITQMWEPHQTSAFFSAIFMKAYMMITGTTTGIVLYTQIVGLFIRGCIAFWLYRVVKEVSGEVPAALAGVFYLLISPKDLLTPEFSNMQLWSGTLLFLALLKYLLSKKKLWLVLSAIAFCLGILSYPSFLIVYVAVILLLYKYSDCFKRDVLIFTCICVLIGGTFLGGLIKRIGTETFVKSLSAALALEPSHTVNMVQKIWIHLKDVFGKIGILVGIFGIGYAVEKVYIHCNKINNNEKRKSNNNIQVLISWYILLIYMAVNILRAQNRCGYAIVLLAIVGFAFSQRKLLQGSQRCMYEVALWIGGLSLLATMLLSDHPFLPSVTYMHVLTCISVVPIYHWFLKNTSNGAFGKACVLSMHVFLILIIFRGLYIHTPIYGRGQICTIFDDLAVIRSGPAAGILTDEDGAARQRDSLIEWGEYIEAGDTIWILGEPVDTLGYLYEDVEVGAPTVMSTPTYSEALLYYWELNPDKYPNVIILASSFGNLTGELSSNSWLMEWLEQEYCADTIIDGNYWRYYFRNDT